MNKLGINIVVSIITGISVFGLKYLSIEFSKFLENGECIPYNIVVGINIICSLILLVTIFYCYKYNKTKHILLFWVLIWVIGNSFYAPWC